MPGYVKFFTCVPVKITPSSIWSINLLHPALLDLYQSILWTVAANVRPTEKLSCLRWFKMISVCWNINYIVTMNATTTQERNFLMKPNQFWSCTENKSDSLSETASIVCCLFLPYSLLMHSLMMSTIVVRFKAIIDKITWFMYWILPLPLLAPDTPKS